MNIQMTAQTIQLILAPVVMVTACGILVGSLVGRYSSISDRLRALAHERLELLLYKEKNALQHERLEQLGVQLSELLRHHKAVHDAVLVIYWAIAILISSMFIIAFASATGSSWLAAIALSLFLLGTGAIFFSMILTAFDFRTAHCAIHYEVRHICRLSKEIY